MLRYPVRRVAPFLVPSSSLTSRLPQFPSYPRPRAHRPRARARSRRGRADSTNMLILQRRAAVHRAHTPPSCSVHTRVDDTSTIRRTTSTIRRAPSTIRRATPTIRRAASLARAAGSSYRDVRRARGTNLGTPRHSSCRAFADCASTVPRRARRTHLTSRAAVLTPTPSSARALPHAHAHLRASSLETSNLTTSNLVSIHTGKVGFNTNILHCTNYLTN